MLPKIFIERGLLPLWEEGFIKAYFTDRPQGSGLWVSLPLTLLQDSKVPKAISRESFNSWSWPWVTCRWGWHQVDSKLEVCRHLQEWKKTDSAITGWNCRVFAESAWRVLLAKNARVSGWIIREDWPSISGHLSLAYAERKGKDATQRVVQGEPRRVQRWILVPVS